MAQEELGLLEDQLPDPKLSCGAQEDMMQETRAALDNAGKAQSCLQSVVEHVKKQTDSLAGKGKWKQTDWQKAWQAAPQVWV